MLHFLRFNIYNLEQNSRVTEKKHYKKVIKFVAFKNKTDIFRSLDLGRLKNKNKMQDTCKK